MGESVSEPAVPRTYARLSERHIYERLSERFIYERFEREVYIYEVEGEG